MPHAPTLIRNTCVLTTDFKHERLRDLHLLLELLQDLHPCLTPLLLLAALPGSDDAVDVAGLVPWTVTLEVLAIEVGQHRFQASRF